MRMPIASLSALVFLTTSTAIGAEPGKYEPADVETIAAFKKLGFRYVEVKPSRSETMEFASRSGTVFMDDSQPSGTGGLPTFRIAGFRLPKVADFPPVAVPFGLIVGGDPSEAWVKDLAALKNLTALSLFGVAEPRAKALAGHKQLTRLELGSTKLTDAGLKELKVLEKLTALGLEGTDVTDAGMADLKEITGLKTLTLPYRITGVGVKELAALKNLGELFIDGQSLTDAGMKEFSGLTALTTLGVGYAKITDAGIAELKGLKQLKELYAGGLQTPVAPVFGDLKDFPSLGVLSLPFNVKDLKAIRGMNKLEGLTLMGCKIIGGGGLKELAGLEQLVRLDLRYANVTDADLKDLKALPKLASLTLFGTPVTDAGLAELREIKTLTYLNLQGSKATPAGVKDLQTALPKCVIVK